MSDSRWLGSEVRTAMQAFTAQMRSCPDGSAPVPSLEWDVADLGGHIACLPALYEAQHVLGHDFEPPADWAAFSANARSHITERSPTALADLIEAEMGPYITQLEADPDAERLQYGQVTTNRFLLGSILGELVLHGQDLAKVTGAKAASLTRDQALAMVPNLMILTPPFVRRDEALKYPCTVHLKFRGGDDWTWVVADGTVTVSRGKPARADAHLHTDPAAFVLTSMGRRNQYLPALTGAMIAWGRKPWTFLQLANLKVDGV